MKRLLLALSLSLTGCSETWEGFVYPNAGDLTKHIGIGSYKSLEECRAAAVDALRQLGALERGDYECGLNCKQSSEFGGIKICEETLD